MCDALLWWTWAIIMMENGKWLNWIIHDGFQNVLRETRCFTFISNKQRDSLGPGFWVASLSVTWSNPQVGTDGWLWMNRSPSAFNFYHDPSCEVSFIQLVMFKHSLDSYLLTCTLFLLIYRLLALTSLLNRIFMFIPYLLRCWNAQYTAMSGDRKQVRMQSPRARNKMRHWWTVMVYF